MGFHLEIHGDTNDFVRQLTANPASVFGRPYGGYLLFLFDNYNSGERVHEWIQQRASSLDETTGESVAFALFSRRLRTDVSSGGDARSSHDEVSAEFEPEELGLNQTGFDVKRLVRSGLFGRIQDRVTIEAVNTAVVRVAREFGVLDKLPCVIVMDGFRIPEGDTISFDVIELSGEDMAGFEKALQVATAQFERHSNHSVYVGKIRSLYVKKAQFEELDHQLKQTKAKEAQARKLLLDTLKRGEWGAFCELVSPVIGSGATESLHDFLREDFERLSRMHSAVTGVADWKTLIWPLEDRELRYVRAPLEGVEDLLQELELGEGLPTAYRQKNAFEKFHNEFRSALGRAASQSLEKLEGRLGEQILSGVYGYLTSKGISDRRARMLASIADDIDGLSTMKERPSWRACLNAALKGKGKFIPAEPRHIADWLLSSGTLGDFIKSLNQGDDSEILKEIVKTHGSDAFLRKPKVFLSYSRDDEKIILERLPFLRLAGAEFFRDKDHIEAGEIWKARLEDEIQKCDFLALFWSWSAAKSAHVRDEYIHALRIGKKICPLVLMPPEPEIPQELQHINFLMRFG